MPKTVILLNPMGADVTPWVNGALGNWKLLRGAILQPGDVLYTLPYKNQSGIANINQGVSMLDAKIRSTGGTVKVVSYSEGAQVADLWISRNAAEAYASDRLSFLSIGNSNRVYGGLIHSHPEFGQFGFTGGLPATVPWPYTDLARQYDGWADFPTDPEISSALAGAVGALLGQGNLQAALGRAIGVLSGPKSQASLNAYYGMQYVHIWYFNVAPGDPGNTSYTAPSGAVYELAGTYPVPMLGTGAAVLSKDTTMRASIEQYYDRPMANPTPKTRDYGFGVRGPA